MKLFYTLSITLTFFLFGCGSSSPSGQQEASGFETDTEISDAGSFSILSADVTNQWSVAIETADDSCSGTLKIHWHYEVDDPIDQVQVTRDFNSSNCNHYLNSNEFYAYSESGGIWNPDISKDSIEFYSEPGALHLEESNNNGTCHYSFHLEVDRAGHGKLVESLSNCFPRDYSFEAEVHLR